MSSCVWYSQSRKVFFIDNNGALCARASGHALDVESQLFPFPKQIPIHLGAPDGRLVLRHRRPLTQPYPNPYSHPLPRFHFHSDTGRLTVKFENDPEFAGGTAWSAKTYYLTALPRHRPRTLLNDATDALASAFRNPLSFFGGPPIPDDSTAAGMDDTFNLRQEEVEEQDRGEDAEDDDDPARDRAVRVIGLTPEEHRELGNKAWTRRQWAVVPLRTAAARYSTMS